MGKIMPEHVYIIERALELSKRNYSCGQIAKQLGIGVAYMRGVLRRHRVVLAYSFPVQGFVQSVSSSLQTVEELAQHYGVSEERIRSYLEEYNLPFLRCRPMPSEPSRDLPGSLGKIEELRRRAEANEQLWHPDDVDYAGHRSGLNHRELRENVPCGFRTAG